MKKKTNYFTVKWWGLSLLLIVCTFNACEWEEEVKVPKKEIETVSIAEAKGLLSSLDIPLPTTFASTSRKGMAISENTKLPYLTVNLEKIGQAPLTNSNERMTVVPGTLNKTGKSTEVLLLKIDGEIESIVFTRYPNNNSTKNAFSGKIIITDFDGKFLRGYGYEDGYAKTTLTLKKVPKPNTKAISASIKKEVRADGLSYGGSESQPFDLDEVTCNGSPSPKNHITTSYLFNRNPIDDINLEGSEPYYLCLYITSTGGGGGGDSDYTPPEPKVNDEDIKDTKADCIKQALESGGSNSLLNKLLAGFKLENSPIDLTYKAQDKVYNKKGDEVNGLCERVKYSNNSIAITIYLSKTRMQTQSFLETARTILHETLHAHLHGMIDAKDNTTFNTIPDADGLNFKDTWKKYIELHPEEKQHNWMAEKYIGLMKEGLSKLYEQWDDATKIRFEEYAGVTDANRDFMFECIAWHGLLGENHDMTEAGKEFYTKKGEEYEKMKDEVIRYLGRNCPTEK